GVGPREHLVAERRKPQLRGEAVEVGVRDLAGAARIDPQTWIQVERDQLIAVPAMNVVDGGGELRRKLALVAERDLMRGGHAAIRIVEKDHARVPTQKAGR